MPRLRLWKPEKSNDYYYIDRAVREQFDIGGTSLLVHKYIGPKKSDTEGNPIPTDETTIQDVLFLENRDRKYDQDIYELSGVYNVSDTDFDLSQFGLFLQSDTIFITLHLNDMIDRMGRRIMSGDVIELPHQLDDTALDLNGTKKPIKKFYVVADAQRGSEGYSQTWWPHIWRIKCTPLTDSQEFKDILGDPNDPDSIAANQTGLATALDIMDTNLEAAVASSPTLEADTSMLVNGKEAPPAWDYGCDIPEGDTFPTNPVQGTMFMRTDFVPPRLFEFRNNKWLRRYDNVDVTTWESRTLNAGPFIHNPRTTVVGDSEFAERQAISKVIKPKADN
jgi:hypothetical protein